jgi:hypothetical protein
MIDELPISSTTLDLTDEETVALELLLRKVIEADRYPLSPRVQAWRAILNKIRPESAREPLPPPLRHYEPPRHSLIDAEGIQP